MAPRQLTLNPGSRKVNHAGFLQPYLRRPGCNMQKMSKFAFLVYLSFSGVFAAVELYYF